MTRARLLQTTLLASVGLNLFLLGVMVPGWLGHHGPPPPMMQQGPGGPSGPGPMGPIGALLREAASRLPDADAALLREHLKERSGDLRAVAEDFENHVEKVRELMRAEPFDPDALAVALTAMAERRVTEDAKQMQSLVALLSRMSPEGRQVLADFRFQHPLMMKGDRTGAIPYDRERGPMPPPGPREGAPPVPPPPQN